MIGDGLKAQISRRKLLASTAIAAVFMRLGIKPLFAERIPWAPDAADPPQKARPGPWQYFTADEAAMVEAIAECIIPSDEFGPGGRESGSAIFIDRELAGRYGRSEGFYLQAPFRKPLTTQGWQSPDTPNIRYRKGLAALARYVSSQFGGKAFGALVPDAQYQLLSDLESGKAELGGDVDAKQFFNLIRTDVQTAFFADPIYGGNKDMAGWKLIGFPGTRYDYLDWIERHNEPYPLPPMSIEGRLDWNVKD